MEAEGKRRRITVVDIPPEGSRHYDDDTMRRHIELATGVDVCGGDLSFRGMREDWKTIGGSATEFEDPKIFGVWRNETRRREREMSRAWPYNLRAANPRTSDDLATRTDWKSDKGDLIDRRLLAAEGGDRSCLESERR